MMHVDPFVCVGLFRQLVRVYAFTIFLEMYFLKGALYSEMTK